MLKEKYVRQRLILETCVDLEKVCLLKAEKERGD